MRLSGRLQSTLRTAIACNKFKPQAQHLPRSLLSSAIQQRTIRQAHFPKPNTVARRVLSTTAALSSPDQTSKSTTMDPTSSETKTENNTAQPESQPSSHQPAVLALPAADSAAPTLEVGGSALRLDHLGPLVVNENGTLSRIANWDAMADIERENTLRILRKRNQMRLAKLRAAKAEPSRSENGSQSEGGRE
ncbi:hypothetical protein GGS21DRAFT_522243 [Xylaria nigripes]|nr:hypothetical protein GGS21DRAFT_522243 [Xylaria nigripes]